MIKLANASSGNTNEKDQVKICDFYEKGWQYILRPIQSMINGFTFIAEKLCENKFVLYSQDQRLTLNKLLSSCNFNLSLITEKVYCDCSSFVGTCLNAVGAKIDVSCFTTSTMRYELTKRGFKAIPYKDKSQLEKGDILLKEGSHTVIVLDGETKNEECNFVGTVSLNDTNSYLNVREKPDVTSKVITTLKHEDKVNVIGQLSDWYRLDNGYCAKRYIVV